jgi:hypothetical protein
MRRLSRSLHGARGTTARAAISISIVASIAAVHVCRATARHFDQFGDHVAADLLFYLMSAMSTVNANTTTPSIKTISSFIEEGSMLGMALEQQSRLRKGIETVISKEKLPKSETRNNTKPKSKRSK